MEPDGRAREQLHDTDVKRSTLIMVLLFLLAGGLRVGWVMYRYAGDGGDVLEYPDEDAYWLAAESLASGKGLIDEFGFRATYMPAYPAFLSIFAGLDRGVLWARVVQALLCALIAPCTWLLARAWWVGRPEQASVRGNEQAVGLLAGLAAAFDPFLIFFSGLLLTEGLFAVAMVAAWTWVLLVLVPGLSTGRSAGRGIAAGIGLGAAVMLRPSAMVLVWVMVGAMLLMRAAALPGQRAWLSRARSRWLPAGVALVTVYAILLPWAMRNRQAIGEFRWLTTRGGISLYDGLQPGATGASDLAHTKTDPAVAELDEVAWDAHWRRLALEELRRDPWRAIRLGWGKFLRTWSLTPNVAEHRGGATAMVSAAWMIAVLAAGAAGAWMHRRSPRRLLWLLLPVAIFTLLHMVFIGSVRYRVPTMPMLEVLAAAGVVGLFAGRRISFSGDEQTTMPDAPKP